MRTCLVVDDSRVVRKVARRILEGQGFVVEEAADGHIALDACRRNMPGSVLLDWNMPVMTGILARFAPGIRPGQSACGFLHHRKRHNIHSTSDRERRPGIHHEAV